MKHESKLIRVRIVTRSNGTLDLGRDRAHRRFMRRFDSARKRSEAKREINDRMSAAGAR